VGVRCRPWACRGGVGVVAIPAGAGIVPLDEVRSVGGIRCRPLMNDESPYIPSSPSLPNPLIDGFLPTRIGSYQVIRLLNSGGMGSVFEARQAQPDRLVALKLLRTTLLTPPQLERFRLEGEALGRLQHANIAQIFEFGTHCQGLLEIPFFAMERVRGARTIVEYANAKALAWRERIGLILPVLDALRHAHTCGIVHRDLKPANILVDETGVVKLIDFGVARLSDRDPSEMLTSPSVLVGTLQYMSPEQAGHKPADERSDQYSLGVVLYELLCGVLPEPPTREGVSSEISYKKSGPILPSVHRPLLPRDLDTVVPKMLSVAPEERYETLDALERDLRHVLVDEPIEAHKPAAWEKRMRATRRWAVRHPAWLSVMLTAVGASVSYPLGTTIDLLGFQDAYESRVTTTLNFVPDEPLGDVIVIALTDQTGFGELASRYNLDRLDPRRNATLRGLHALLLERLVKSGAGAVAVDIHFSPVPTPDDAPLAAAARHLERSGIPCVLARRPFDGGDAEVVTINSALTTSRPGFIGANVSATAPWNIVLAAQRPNAPTRPSLALAAAAAHAAATGGHVDMATGITSLGNGTAAFVTHHSFLRRMETDLAALGYRKDDLLAHFTVEMPPLSTLAGNTIDFGAALTLDDGALRHRCAGRVVLIGDLRAGQDGPFPHASKIPYHGLQANAVAIQMLITGQCIRWLPYVEFGPLTLGTPFPMLLLAATAGCWAGRITRTSRTSLALIASFAAPIAASLISYQVGGWLWSPATYCLAVVITFALARGATAAHLFRSEGVTLS